jgi:hypothetical protein
MNERLPDPEHAALTPPVKGPVHAVLGGAVVPFGPRSRVQLLV